MRLLAALVILTAFTACSGKDEFITDVKPYTEPPYSKNFKLDTATSESFAVDVDILWVIDNSGSMGPYQNAVIANSAAFMQQFSASSRLQWRMGLISTDEFDQPYMGFNQVVDWTTSNAVQVFNAAVSRLGVNGSGLEAAFSPTIKALNGHPNFFRKGAYLIQIFVSDELEQSWQYTTAQYLNALKAKLGGDIGKYFAYGVYGPGSNDSWNKKYNEVVQATNGKVYQLTSPDFGVLLADLGKDLVTRVTVVYPIVILDQKPKLGTIKVTYKGRVLTPGTDWAYNPAYNYVEIRNTAILDSRVLDINVTFQIDRT